MSVNLVFACAGFDSDQALNMALVKLESFLISNCCLLLAVILTSWQSTAQASRLLNEFQQSTRFSDSGSQPVMIRAELLHRDHPLSPLAPAEGVTFGDRLAAAAKRSHGRHQLLMTRGRRLSAFQTPVELKGGVGGEYVMSISFGTPPQHFTGLVDTGSDLVWIQCVPCATCYPPIHGHPNAPYDPAASSSEVFVPCSDLTLCNPNRFQVTKPCKHKSQHCRIEYSYMDGSQIEGTLTTETLTLNNTAGSAPLETSFLMGCMNNNTGYFDNYDGIIGFGRGVNSLPTQLSTRGDLQVFAYCLVPFAADTTLTSSLIFGKRDTNNRQGLVYTSLLPIEESYYWVEMVGLSVDGEDLGLDPALFRHDATTNTGGVIFDSGTTYTYLATPVYDAIFERISNLTLNYTIEPPDPSNGGYCILRDGLNIDRSTRAPVRAVPLVTFHFADVAAGTVVDYALELDNLYTSHTIGHDDSVVCLAFLSDNSGANMVIGSIAQANHYIEHDVVNMVMGWKSKDCTV